MVLARKTLPLALLAVIFALAAFPAPGACEDKARDALELVRETYASLDGLTAEFVQTEERPGVGVTVREEGTLSFRPPDRMRWDYGGKRPHAVVLNGSRVWIHTPSRNQVVVRRMSPEEMRRGAATFLGGLDGVEDDFSVSSGSPGPDGDVPLDLVPLEDNLPYDRISIVVSPETGLVRRLSIHHKLGNVTTIAFDRIRTGVVPPDKLFKWDIPEGTEVIEP